MVKQNDSVAASQTNESNETVDEQQDPDHRDHDGQPWIAGAAEVWNGHLSGNPKHDETDIADHLANAHGQIQELHSAQPIGGHGFLRATERTHCSCANRMLNVSLAGGS
jgi:hypothetical protein